MASNVSKYAQLSSASVACVAVSNADKRNQLKQWDLWHLMSPKSAQRFRTSVITYGQRR